MTGAASEVTTLRQDTNANIIIIIIILLSKFYTCVHKARIVDLKFVSKLIKMH